jgi:hypothetical protein
MSFFIVILWSIDSTLPPKEDSGHIVPHGSMLFPLLIA